MKIIWDASLLTMYPMAGDGFRGGTETMIEQLTRRLALMGHTVHIVCRDAQVEQQRGENLWYWPMSYHPTEADVVVMTQQILQEFNYEAPILILAHTGCDPYLGPNGQWAGGVDAWPVFCEEHKKMLLEQRPLIPEDRVFVTGLGIELGDYNYGEEDYTQKYKDAWVVPGRMFYANDPMRGLFYVLDIFNLVKKKIPTATLHVAYDADRQFAVHQWEMTYKAQLSWEMKERLENTPGVVNLGALSREELIREQLECQVHCMPSDPPNIGTQTWGITQMECAAAGAALVLSDVEAFPEVFGSAAVILPVIGRYTPEIGRRITAQDYANEVIRLMKKPKLWKDASRKARTLSENNTWQQCAERWDNMIIKLQEKVIV